MERITVQLTDPALLNRLQTLAVEYSVTPDILITLAVKRLIDDVDFFRNLRAEKIKLE